MKKPKLVVSSLVFDVDVISKALHIDASEVVAAFNDGRGAWPFSELWGKNLYDFIKHTNTNMPFSDGTFALDNLETQRSALRRSPRGASSFSNRNMSGAAGLRQKKP